MNKFFQILPEIEQAFNEKRAVVALESTIIAHGMPYPKNIETAMAVENIVRENGAVPATIAVLNGQCHVGLSNDQLEHLGKAKNVWKVSLRDLPFVVSRRSDGATTVAATLRIASMAGIKIFVTGGIGGVHRGASTSMDISADLEEMGKTSAAIISAGVKSILDIGLTLERLETLGVPIVTLGQDEFPSFYSRTSGYLSPLRLDDVESIASFLDTKWKMGLPGSVLVANPVPSNMEIPAEEMETYIEKAIASAKEHKVVGKAVTPFLLKYISENTQGESLETNIALIRNNAEVGARIAVDYTKIISRQNN